MYPSGRATRYLTCRIRYAGGLRSAGRHNYTIGVERIITYQGNEEQAPKILQNRFDFPFAFSTDFEGRSENKLPTQSNRGHTSSSSGAQAPYRPCSLSPGAGPDLDLHLVLLPSRVRLLPVQPADAVRVHLHVEVPDHPRQDRLGLGVRQAGERRVSINDCISGKEEG